MKELLRILEARAPVLAAPSVLLVVLMAGVGAAQALMALLIGPIFDRVLRPQIGGCAGAAVHHSGDRAAWSI